MVCMVEVVWSPYLRRKGNCRENGLAFSELIEVRPVPNKVRNRTGCICVECSSCDAGDICGLEMLL